MAISQEFYFWDSYGQRNGTGGQACLFIYGRLMLQFF